MDFDGDKMVTGFGIAWLIGAATSIGFLGFVVWAIVKVVEHVTK